MTAKHTAQFPLPLVADPPDTVCVVVRVPNDENHLLAFWQALWELARWFNWERDEDHTGQAAAAVWLRQFRLAQEENCMNYIVRQNPLNSCELQRSFDAGETWESWANLRLCAESTLNDLFGPGAEQPGSRSQPGEQPGGANPDPGQCFDLDLTVNANGMTLIPLAITDGWTLQLTQVKGAWTDGGFLSMWACPTGKQFSMGACSNVDMQLESTDPIPTIPHMKLIARLPDGTFAELPLDGNSYTVPSGQPSGNMFLLPNDGGLADNQGSVTLHLLACSPEVLTVHCTYLLQATGPTEIHIGDTFDIEVNTANGGTWNGGVRFDRCCTLTYIATIDGPVTQADWEDCNGGGHSGFGTTNVTKMGFNSFVQRFTLRLRLDSVI